MSIDDFAENKEYITCHVFKGGSHVYYPEDAFIQGTKINSPHVLTKLSLTPGSHAFTVVISQHEKASTIRYSLKTFSTAPVQLRKLVPVYRYCARASDVPTTLRGSAALQNVHHSRKRSHY